MSPAPAELDGAVQRAEFTKTFHGDVAGSASGLMLSAGDPESGTAGYVAIEIVRGTLAERSGTFALQQFGTMLAGEQTQYYEIVPGSGTGELAGITGILRLTIDPDRTHHYELEYDS